jgi:hypothetical protein
MYEYYKYKSLSNWQYLIDILVNDRLYAAKYTELNDPMEGCYITTNKQNTKLIHDLLYEKSSTRILSLTTNDRNWLMWSHYADSHRGYCIKVRLRPNSKLNVSTIQYVTDVPQVCDSLSGCNLLSQKSKIWEYEDERRVFTKKSYVDVVIEGITFGYRVPNAKFELLKKLIIKIKPELEGKIYKVKKEDLYSGFYNESL